MRGGNIQSKPIRHIYLAKKQCKYVFDLHGFVLMLGMCGYNV